MMKISDEFIVIEKEKINTNLNYKTVKIGA